MAAVRIAAIGLKAMGDVEAIMDRAAALAQAAISGMDPLAPGARDAERVALRLQRCATTLKLASANLPDEVWLESLGVVPLRKFIGGG